jgi:hypothetical protein
MTLSDLPPHAEASFAKAGLRRAEAASAAQAGNRFPLFGVML